MDAEGSVETVVGGEKPGGEAQLGEKGVKEVTTNSIESLDDICDAGVEGEAP